MKKKRKKEIVLSVPLTLSLQELGRNVESTTDLLHKIQQFCVLFSSLKCRWLKSSLLTKGTVLSF
jgi:hypothetical protein